jgi:hypothetical protein
VAAQRALRKSAARRLKRDGLRAAHQVNRAVLRLLALRGVRHDLAVLRLELAGLGVDHDLVFGLLSLQPEHRRD